MCGILCYVKYFCILYGLTGSELWAAFCVALHADCAVQAQPIWAFVVDALKSSCATPTYLPEVFSFIKLGQKSFSQVRIAKVGGRVRSRDSILELESSSVELSVTFGPYICLYHILYAAETRDDSNSRIETFYWAQNKSVLVGHVCQVIELCRR